MKEQLLYELGDPKNYITPDCVADFTSVRLADDGDEPRARHRHSRRAAPAIAEALHQLRQRLEGDRHAGLLLAAGAGEGAGGRRHRARSAWRISGCTSMRSTRSSSASTPATAPAAPPNADPPEVQLRIGVRGQDKKAVDRFTRELIPLVLNGPPGATGFGEGRPPVREIVAYWSALVPREEIVTRVEVVE